MVLDPFGLVRHGLHASEPAAPSVPEAKARPLKALVVDDAISVRRAARKYLRPLGLETDEAADGLEALRKLRTGSYSLILTDLEMPRMDGFELLAELKRMRVCATTPVVVISSLSDPRTLRRVLDLGARALIPKPIEPDDFAGVIVPLLQPAPKPKTEPLALALAALSFA
jgi:chemosensory pili system protein ChpA (sensor histidine kinase/response regulator)